MGEERMYEEILPTQERLSKKGETFDTPLIDTKTNRRLYRRLDIIQALLRDGKIQSAHGSAWNRFLAHFQGRQKLDVRVVSEFTFINQSLDLLMPPWQYHGAELAECKNHLLPDEYQGLEFIADFETNPRMMADNPIAMIGSQFGGYKNRPCAYAYGVRLLMGGLDRLSYLWGFKQREGGK